MVGCSGNDSKISAGVGTDVDDMLAVQGDEEGGDRNAQKIELALLMR